MGAPGAELWTQGSCSDQLAPWGERAVQLWFCLDVVGGRASAKASALQCQVVTGPSYEIGCTLQADSFSE